MFSFSLSIVLAYLYLVSTIVVQSKVFTKCELEAQLLLKEVPNVDLAAWICLAEAVSLLNSSAIRHASTAVADELRNDLRYGIFQISEKHCCQDMVEGDASGLCDCNLNCSSLIDDDISNDIECALRVRTNGSHAFSYYWPEFEQYCTKEITSGQHLSECSEIPRESDSSPRITNFRNNTIILNGKEQVLLICEADGNPKPDLKWVYNETKFPNIIAVPTENRKGVILGLPYVTQGIGEDIFVCEAANKFGKVHRTISVKFPEQSTGNYHDEPNSSSNDNNDPNSNNNNSGFTFGLISGIVLAFLISALAFGILACRNNYRKRGHRIESLGLTRDEISEFENGDPDGLIFNAFAHENAQFQPYNREYEILDDQLIIETDKLLGRGAYGLVYKGKKDGVTVAVKTIKPCSDKLYIKALLSELKVMIYIGKHPNIVNLIGAKTTQLDKGLLHIIVEYCALGNLEQFIKLNRSNFKCLDTAEAQHYANEHSTTVSITYENITIDLSSYDLLRWSYQISAGMKYLESKKVIHGDLATRNVLLADKTHLKITDFGLSRQLYDYTNYVKKQQAPLPWRWMAVESLRSMTFSHQSDVWSFGVTMWEIYSLIEVPYSAGFAWSIDFVSQLENGLRLPKPKYCSDEMYTKMLDCWRTNPAERPSISLLHDWLESMIAQENEGSEERVVNLTN